GGKGIRLCAGNRSVGARVAGREGVAGRREQAIALGTAEAAVAADFGQTDAADELALRCPHGHAAVADVAAGVARAPDVPVDVAARAARPALDAVPHEVADELAVRQ